MQFDREYENIWSIPEFRAQEFEILANQLNIFTKRVIGSKDKYEVIGRASNVHDLFSILLFRKIIFAKSDQAA